MRVRFFETTGQRRGILKLHAREWVEVRSVDEIVATLDENGSFDGLPFIPEMLNYCGKRLQVYRRAHKTCDTIEGRGRLRRLRHTVHLEETRCAGDAHGGCQAECLLFWKEAWLKRVSRDAAFTKTPSQTGYGASTEAIWRGVHAPDSTEQDEIFSCQATELQKFTEPMGAYDPRQFWEDIWSRNISVFPLMRSVLLSLFNALQRKRGGTEFPNVTGLLDKTPKEFLDLQPGELVQIKSKAEIESTLDKKEKNRGLYFDREMLPFCDGTFRVKKRVNKIINERTGKMMGFGSDTIMLDGVTCAAHYHAYCPRAIYSYWREIWLKRVGPGEAEDSVHAPSCVAVGQK